MTSNNHTSTTAPDIAIDLMANELRILGYTVEVNGHGRYTIEYSETGILGDMAKRNAKLRSEVDRLQKKLIEANGRVPGKKKTNLQALPLERIALEYNSGRSWYDLADQYGVDRKRLARAVRHAVPSLKRRTAKEARSLRHEQDYDPDTNWHDPHLAHGRRG